MNNRTDFFCGLALLCLCAMFGYQLWLLPKPNSQELVTLTTFPTGVLCVLTVLSALLLLKGWRWPRKDSANWPERAILIPIAKIALLIALYIGAFIVLGGYAQQQGVPTGTVFVAATFLFLLAAMYVANYRVLKSMLCVAAGMVTALYLTFVYMFNVPLP